MKRTFLLVLLIFLSACTHRPQDNSGTSILLCSYIDKTGAQGRYTLKTLRLEWIDWEEKKLIIFKHDYVMKVYYLLSKKNKENIYIATYGDSTQTWLNHISDKRVPQISKAITLAYKDYDPEKKLEIPIKGLFLIQNSKLEFTEDGIHHDGRCGAECTRAVLIKKSVKKDLEKFCPKRDED